MSYVVAIDVGVKNLGLCVFDFLTGHVVEWDRLTLVPNGRYMPSQNVRYVRDFVQQYSHFFDQSFAVLVERQMRCNMRIIESVLHALFYERCIIINPRSVKMHYNLSTRNYRQNKQKAVAFVESYLARNSQAFADAAIRARFDDARKQDDLADSLLLVLYYLDTYSNKLTSGTHVGLEG